MFVTVEILYGTREKRKSVNNIVKHNVCEGREYKRYILKAVEKGSWEGRGKGEQ
jgi:hypothetical protein